jgi:hypothetical protein
MSVVEDKVLTNLEFFKAHPYFGKINLRNLTQKNKARLDKHHILREYRTARYRAPVKTIIPAFSKAEKAKSKRLYKYLPATNRNTRRVTEYFKEDSIFDNTRSIHSHGIGTVSFYKRELIGTKKQIQFNRVRHYVPVRYYFKADVNFGYTPLPGLYDERDAAVLQRSNRVLARKIAEKQEIQRIYNYLINNKANVDCTTKPSTDTELKNKVYYCEISVPAPDTTTEEDLPVTEYQFQPIFHIEPYTLTIDEWAIRVKYCGEQEIIDKNLRTKNNLPEFEEEWRQEYWAHIREVLSLLQSFDRAFN